MSGIAVALDRNMITTLMENDPGDSRLNSPRLVPGEDLPDSERTFGAKQWIAVSVTLIPWLVLLALFSLLPEQPIVPIISSKTASLAGHFLVYAVLAALVYRLHTRIWSGPDRRPFDSALTAIVTATVIGLFFELSQQFFTDNRTFETKDVFANASGATAVSTALMLLELAGVKLKLLMPAVFATGAALTVFSAVSYAVWDTSLPYAGDHWHVAYRVVICGETQRLFPTGTGNIHTHGRGVIHMHPQGDGDEGKQANLAKFFASNGGILTDSSLTLPSGETFTNGDVCPDGTTGFVSVSKFDTDTLTRTEVSTSPAGYVPRDLETILIEFGPVPGES